MDINDYPLNVRREGWSNRLLIRTRTFSSSTPLRWRWNTFKVWQAFTAWKKRDNRIEEGQIQWNARTYLLGIVLLKRCILPRLTQKVIALAPASRQSCVETVTGRQASVSHFPALGRRARFTFSPSSDWCILSARVVIGHAEKRALFSTNQR